MLINGGLLGCGIAARWLGKAAIGGRRGAAGSRSIERRPLNVVLSAHHQPKGVAGGVGADRGERTEAPWNRGLRDLTGYPDGVDVLKLLRYHNSNKVEVHRRGYLYA